MKKLTLNDLKSLDFEALYKVSVALDKATDIKDDAKRHAAEREFFADGEATTACIRYLVNNKDLYLKRTAKSRAKTAAMTRALSYDYSKVSVCSEFF